MCVLWFLLQLVVVFLYWDLPPQRGNGEESASRGSEGGKEEEENADDDDEEKPLIASQELAGSYGSVAPPKGPAASNGALNHGSSPPREADKPSGPGFLSLRGVRRRRLSFVVSGSVRFNVTSGRRVHEGGGGGAPGCTVHHTLQSDGAGGSVATQEH